MTNLRGWSTPWGSYQDPPISEPEDHQTLDWYEWRWGLFMAMPPAGSKARGEYIAKIAPPLALGPMHLHAVYNRGRVMWVATRPGRLCKEPGRCAIIYIDTLVMKEASSD